MISLTPRQRDLRDFIVRERSQGREPTMRQIPVALGNSSKSNGSEALRRLHARMPRKEIEKLVPRAPDGRRLKLVPVKGLPMPWEGRDDG